MQRRRARNESIPQHGVIVGGRLNGWAYGFRRFEIDAHGTAIVVAFCTPPHWPFGREIACTWDRAHRFAAVSGERAKRLAVEPLITAALRGHTT